MELSRAGDRGAALLSDGSGGGGGRSGDGEHGCWLAALVALLAAMGVLHCAFFVLESVVYGSAAGLTLFGPGAHGGLSVVLAMNQGVCVLPCCCCWCCCY